MTITSSLRANTLNPETTSWLFHLISLLDDKNLDEYLKHFHPSTIIRFNNGHPTFRGIDEARTGLAAFWSTFDTIEHEELNVYGDERTLVHEALNHFVTLDGRRVTVCAVAFIDRDEQGLITELRVYGDQSGLWKKE